MNTKEQILATALQLFNQEGLDAVTLRRIAGAMGISQGNLNYHYKKREDIVLALYLNLVARINKEFEELQLTNDILGNMFKFSEKIMLSLYDYRFIMLDFVQVMRRHPEIKASHKQLNLIRKEQFKQLYAQMQAEGIMRAEKFEGEYDNLILRGMILGDSWLASAEILLDIPEDRLVPYFIKVLNEMMFPYFTEEGMKRYMQISNGY